MNYISLLRGYDIVIQSIIIIGFINIIFLCIISIGIIIRLVKHHGLKKKFYDSLVIRGGKK